jgi:broad specificity phosphatase PhoE
VNVFAIRHGETAWSLSGQHTGATDLPLTDNGRRLAKRMRPVFATQAFGLTLCSPMQRARETCELAGLGGQGRRRRGPRGVELRRVRGTDAQANPGDGAGLAHLPGWMPGRRDAGTGGCTRVIARSRAIDGDTALFAHGHVLRASLWRAGSGCLRAAVNTSC